MLENIVVFQNCCSSQAITDRNLKLGRALEKKHQSDGKVNYFYQFLSLTLIFRRVKIEKFVKCEPE